MDTSAIPDMQNMRANNEPIVLMEAFFQQFSPEKASEILTEWYEMRLSKKDKSLDNKNLERFAHFFDQLDKLVLSLDLLTPKIPSL